MTLNKNIKQKLKDIALTEEAFVSLYKEWQHENKLIIGRYLPNDSYVHHLDPRAKLMFVFFLLY